MNHLSQLYPIDYILLLITLTIVFFSIWRGFIQSLLGLMTWIGSIIITLLFYKNLSNYIADQLNKINIMEQLGLSNIFAIIVSIPLIFILSLIVLKKLRTIISADVDKAAFGIIIDKFFGMIYGIVFSYLIFSVLIIVTDQINTDLSLFLFNHSLIFDNINLINQNYIIDYVPFLNQDNTIIVE